VVASLSSISAQLKVCSNHEAPTRAQLGLTRFYGVIFARNATPGQKIRAVIQVGIALRLCASRRRRACRSRRQSVLTRRDDPQTLASYIPSMLKAYSLVFPLPSMPDREYPDPQYTVPFTTAGAAFTELPAPNDHNICPVAASNANI
jgi:hypothetical protein